MNIQAKSVDAARVEPRGPGSARFSVVSHDPALTVQVATYPFGVVDVVMQGTQRQLPLVYCLDGKTFKIDGQKDAIDVALALAADLKGTDFSGFPWLVTPTHAGIRLVPTAALKVPAAVRYLNTLPRR